MAQHGTTFKAVNDRYGHQIGDQVLVSSVRYLLNHVRVYDKIFRYGGEEFMLVMPATNITSARNIAERLRRGIETTTIAGPQDEHIGVTASFGLTILDPDASVEQSIARADRALYMAKAQGRNCVRVWDPSMDVHSSG